ncbi:DUF3658 domain-containing protein [Rufibacter latericius]|uniref:DUF1835 domain-containing protein n=1 Tax=Rufibacter latericius TaxID=2487040 RepID=A0A3M9MM38_9BACT|nr:DUF3658 domain-containing protein [Rufibacter latericius]RNI25953.1 DUF1835 domain-containing protein [Rufibacter latericius]
MASEKIHIVFGETAELTLLSIKEMTADVDSVVSLNDDLRVGPINLGSLDGRVERQNWVTSNLPCKEDAAYLRSYVTGDFDKIQSIRDNSKDKAEIYIWCGRTTSERLATARLVFELQGYFSNLTIADIPKNGNIAESLSVMNPEQVHLIHKYFKKTDQEEYGKWVTMWARLKSENSLMRVARADGVIESKEVSYFDDTLLSHCKEELLKAARIVGESLVDIWFEASDSTLNWRLVQLVKSGELEVDGKLNCLREYKVKRATTKTKQP